MSQEGKLSHLVVVGASAGGIGALSKFIPTLPEDFPVPIVVAQHLDPDRESRLQEILSRESKLPVRTVVDHEHLEAGVIYVVPANRHVRISDSELGLQTDAHGRPKPSVDLLLSSAAEVFGEHLIAVILSGTGTDGAGGARAVKEAGGTVVIQNPDTAEFGGMPGALAPNTVDMIVELERIGPTLEELLVQAELPEEEQVVPEDEKRSLKRFLEHLRGRYGVDFTSYKTPTIARRLKRRMVATGSENFEEYSGYLEGHPQEYRQLINAFLIKVTEFFRDPALFAYLKKEILPRLVEEARREERQLRIWSAGCATGEEAYTLAILVSEVLGSEAALSDVRIFATDADEEAVNFARHGIYPAGALAGLSEEQIDRYFIESHDYYEVKKPVRNLIVFGEHDLARRSPFPRIDLVVSRNVLIYFAPELQRRALQLFAYSLRDGGHLVLGKAETTSPLSGDLFVSEHRQHKVYRRQGERFLMPAAMPTNPLPTKQRPAGPVAGLGVPGLQRRAEAQDQALRTRAKEENILNRLPVGVVLVDRRYDIQSINAAGRRLLSVRGAAVGEDLLHATQEIPYSEVRNAIDSAFRDGVHTTGEFSVEEATTGEPRYVQLVCLPQRDEKGLAETVMIVVNDVTEIGSERRRLEDSLEETRAELERFSQGSEAEKAQHEAQNERLVEANHRLEEANRELTSLNEELQSSYEESLLTAEEAQAATEEVETLNEELQATNEELETLNEELQATIEELNTTNDDLQARSVELQESARSREEERRTAEAARQRLEAILRGMNDPVLAVGPDGKVLFSNEPFTQMFGDGEPGEEDGGQALGDFPVLDEAGERLPTEATPQVRASRGESFEMRFAVAGGDGEFRRFEARGLPIEGENLGGGVIVMREFEEAGQHLE
jgi:two-component system, chemotaxis family, CheB/CheR fusion protein